jgi:hypothetical protein
MMPVFTELIMSSSIGRVCTLLFQGNRNAMGNDSGLGFSIEEDHVPFQSGFELSGLSP